MVMIIKMIIIEAPMAMFIVLIMVNQIMMVHNDFF